MLSDPTNMKYGDVMIKTGKSITCASCHGPLIPGSRARKYCQCSGVSENGICNAFARRVSDHLINFYTVTHLFRVAALPI
jgi:RNase P subunit RPR2